MRAILFMLLAVNCLQFAAGLTAIWRGRRSLRANAPSLARFSFSHAALLLGGAAVLSVPVLLGLFHVLAASVGVYVAVGLEIAAFIPARETVKRFEAAHLARRPEIPIAG